MYEFRGQEVWVPRRRACMDTCIQSRSEMRGAYSITLAV